PSTNAGALAETPGRTNVDARSFAAIFLGLAAADRTGKIEAAFVGAPPNDADLIIKDSVCIIDTNRDAVALIYPAAGIGLPVAIARGGRSVGRSDPPRRLKLLCFGVRRDSATRTG